MLRATAGRDNVRAAPATHHAIFGGVDAQNGDGCSGCSADDSRSRSCVQPTIVAPTRSRESSSSLRRAVVIYQKQHALESPGPPPCTQLTL